MSFSAQQAYRNWVVGQNQLPFRMQPVWLDAVNGAAGWEGVLHMHDGRVVAAMAYPISQKWGLKQAVQRPADTYLTYWFDEIGLGGDDAKAERKLGNRYKLTDALLSQLPDYQRFALRLHPGMIPFGLPWFQHGFQLQTYYTMRLDLQKGRDAIWADLRHHVRSDLTKAGKTQLTIGIGKTWTDAHEALLDTHYRRHGRQRPFSKGLLERLTHLDAITCLTEVRLDGVLQAFTLIAYDHKEASLLVQAQRPEASPLQALQLAQWRSIEHCIELGCQVFDFEGSMVTSIEHQLRAWGGQPTPYIYATRFKHKRLAHLLGLK
jgi:Acetyltransferase (GNAT) domain